MFEVILTTFTTLHWQLYINLQFQANSTKNYILFFRAGVVKKMGLAWLNLV